MMNRQLPLISAVRQTRLLEENCAPSEAVGVKATIMVQNWFGISVIGSPAASSQVP
jgi:hypothetical protein